MVHLITQGGLGNLIFQHNAAYAFARDHEQTLNIVKTQRNIPERPDCTFYANLFRHVTFTDYIVTPVYREPRYTYVPIPSSAKTLDGYFQSWKYFAKYETELRDLFVSNERETYTAMERTYRAIAQGKPTTCVHIRRGDYLKTPTIHPAIGESFFTQAIDDRSRRLLVFSDSLDMIRDWDLWKTCTDIHFVEDVPGALETLFLMSMCDEFVISNSSLSLCAYFMRANRNARLTVPAGWFGPDGPQFSMDDLVPPGTRIIA
jgi:Glycosyl transferase family 11